MHDGVVEGWRGWGREGGRERPPASESSTLPLSPVSSGCGHSFTQWMSHRCPAPTNWTQCLFGCSVYTAPCQRCWNDVFPSWPAGGAALGTTEGEDKANSRLEMLLGQGLMSCIGVKLHCIFCTFIVPHITYCVEVWGHTYKIITKQTFMLQKSHKNNSHSQLWWTHTLIIYTFTGPQIQWFGRLQNCTDSV